jgi:hypothetical protein
MGLEKPPVATQTPHQQEYQTKASLEQAPPVQNTWYTLLDTITNTELLYIAMTQLNDESAAKSCQVRITVDGQTLTSASVSLNHNTTYYAYILPYGTLTISSNVFLAHYGYPLISKSVKVEVRLADTAGTNQQLNCYATHTKLKETTV